MLRVLGGSDHCGFVLAVKVYWTMFESLLSGIWWLFLCFTNPVFLAILCIGAVVFYRWYTKQYGLWKSLGVPGPEGKFPWGNGKVPFVTPIWEIEEFLYEHAKGKYCGYYELRNPVMFVTDPDLIRTITIKDFDSFVNRRTLVASEEFQGMLQVLRDKEWKETRAVMSPTFSASKLKGMHELCIQTSNRLLTYIDDTVKESGFFEAKDTFGRYTMDNIALCAFGVDCNSFDDPNTEFAAKAAKLFSAPGAYGMFHFLLLLVFPKLAMKLPDPVLPILNFFSKVTRDTIKHREESGSTRKDFLQLMLDTKDKEGNRLLTNRSIVDQSVLFYIAGYDTTATLLTFVAYSLVMNKEVQRKVHDEIDACVRKHDGKISYEAVTEMTYLDRVIAESLRLYPPATRGEREARVDYTLPGTDVTIPQGTVVQFPIYCLHRDEQHYPDPLTFDPDRFLPEVKETRHPCTWIPFGSGPRNCIAMRFALFEAKVALVCVLKKFELLPTSKTPSLPLKFDNKSFLLTPEGRQLIITAVNRDKTPDEA